MLLNFKMNSKTSRFTLLHQIGASVNMMSSAPLMQWNFKGGSVNEGADKITGNIYLKNTI